MKLLIAILLICSSSQVSCKHYKPETLVPVTAVSRVASFDGNEQNSGIIQYIPDLGFEITDSAKKRYIDLNIKFKTDPVGLSESLGRNILNKEGMVLFLELNDKNSNK